MTPKVPIIELIANALSALGPSDELKALSQAASRLETELAEARELLKQSIGRLRYSQYRCRIEQFLTRTAARNRGSHD